MSEDDDAAAEYPPSKSERKREAHARQKLGERLVAMRETDLDALNLGLPEDLREAFREARRLTHRGALSRHNQYIGKLMRHVDAQAIEAALAAREAAHAQHARMSK